MQAALRNITVVAMPKNGASSFHLIEYIRQDPLWDAELDRAPGWPPCVWTTKIKPYSGRVSQLMLENPNSIIGFQPIGHFLTMQILAGQAAYANQADDLAVNNPNADCERSRLFFLFLSPAQL